MSRTEKRKASDKEKESEKDKHKKSRSARSDSETRSPRHSPQRTLPPPPPLPVASNLPYPMRDINTASRANAVGQEFANPANPLGGINFLNRQPLNSWIGAACFNRLKCEDLRENCLKGKSLSTLIGYNGLSLTEVITCPVLASILFLVSLLIKFSLGFQQANNNAVALQLAKEMEKEISEQREVLRVRQEANDKLKQLYDNLVETSKRDLKGMEDNARRARADRDAAERREKDIEKERDGLLAEK